MKTKAKQNSWQRWTDEEINIATTMKKNGYNFSQIGAYLERSPQAIYLKIRKTYK